jgi:pyruvate-ferredoxin/flavodoxin oxidoreductase
MDKMMALQGDDLPVSKMIEGGLHPIGTCEFEKRELAPQIPVWIPDNCTQCN